MKHPLAMIRCCAAALLAAACAWPLAADATEDDAGVWTTFTTTDAFGSGGETSRFRYWLDAQARYFDVGSGVNQWLIRPGIGYQLDERVRVWAGYARYRTRARSGGVADENRYWQQLDWAAGHRMGGTLSLRVRLEQRSLSIGEDLGLALRVMAKYVRPLGAGGRTDLILAVEPIFDLRDTDWGGESGFGQSRAFAGLGWPLNDKVAIEAGYMNQYIKADRGEDLRNHLAVLNFRLRY